MNPKPLWRKKVLPWFFVILLLLSGILTVALQSSSAFASSQRIFEYPTNEKYHSSTGFSLQLRVGVTPQINGMASIDFISVQVVTPGLGCGGAQASFEHKITSEGKVLVDKKYRDNPNPTWATVGIAGGDEIFLQKPTDSNKPLVKQGNAKINLGALLQSYVLRQSFGSALGDIQMECREEQEFISRDNPEQFGTPKFEIQIPVMTTSETTVKKPGGLWAYPSPENNATISNPITLAAIAKLGSADIERVKFTAWWSALGSSGSWLVVCDKSTPTDASKNLYSCNWDLNNVPAGQVNISFDVYDKSGQVNEAPNGIRTLLYKPDSQTSSASSSSSSSTSSPAVNCTADFSKVVVYEGKKYTGACKSFGVGIVNDLAQYGLSSNVSSIKVPDTLTLFMSSGTNQGGTPSSWNQDVPDLSTHQWDNMARSLKVEEKQNIPPRCAYSDTQVAFFTDANFNGDCVIKGGGTYNDPAAIGLSNDSISSIRVGSQAKLQACANDGLNSPCQWFDPGTSNAYLGNTTVGDNQISSAKILDLTQSVTLCSNTNYTGECKSWDGGSVNDLSQYGLSGSISSIKVPSNRTLFLYDRENQQGTPSTWNENVPDLSVHNWNDMAKSFKIEPKLDTSCSIPSNANGIVAYHDRDYSPNGGCKLFTTNVPDFGAVWHTRISSLKFVGNFVKTKKVTLYTDANYGNVCGVYTINQSDLRACAQQDIVSMKIENYTPPAQSTNISSSAVLDPNTADNVVDNNLDTEWIGGNKHPIGFSFDSVAIKGITIYDRKQSSSDNNQINKARVEFSDGTIVDNIDMTSGGPRCAQINFPTKTITWYRIVPIDASGNNGFREIETWDTNGDISSECVMKYNITPVAGEVTAPASASSQSEPQTVNPTPSPTVAPTPEPTQEAQQTQPVVFENFQSGSGWGLSNSQFTQEGNNQFLRMTPNIDAESWKDVGQAALQNYNTIQFRIRTNGAQLWANEGSRIYLDQGGRWYYVTLRDKVDLNNSDWQTIEIPISEFEQWGFDRNQSFDRLGFQFHYENATVNIDVDDIVFLP